MTDRPYTDADLRAEAARQHKTLTEDPDYVGTGEMMEGRYVRYEIVDPEHGDLMPPHGTPRWDDLSEDDFEAAREKIHDLVCKAADTSDWAVNLGAAGLTPHEPHALYDATGGWLAAIQVATSNELTDAARDELLPAIREAVEQTVCRVLGYAPPAPQN